MTPSRNPYAQRTKCSVAQSQSEVAKLVESIGADSIVQGREGDRFVFMFKIGPRAYRYQVDGEPGDAAETRRRWRVLVLRVKSRVVLIHEAGESVEAAFMPAQVLPDGRTVEDAIGPSLAEGRAPKLIGGGFS